jgi:hypothetical protein
MMVRYKKLLGDIKASLRDYKTPELDAWRRHVVENPYSDGVLSELIINMLNREIDRRKERHPPISPIAHSP